LIDIHVTKKITMAPLDIASLLARTFPSDSSFTSSSSVDVLGDPSASPPTHSSTEKSAKVLSAGASVAIAIVFLVLVFSAILTGIILVRRSRRREREREQRKVELGTVTWDGESEVSVVKGGEEVKKPGRVWGAWLFRS